MTLVIVAALVLAATSVAGAAPANRTSGDVAPFATQGGGDAHQHGGDHGHLPGSRSNVELVGSLEPTSAFGFGDLSIHEFATDPSQNLAYVSYYSGGMRVFRFGEQGLTPVGHYIAEGGNNFWGVETFVAGQSAPKNLRGKTLFAGSDRDNGIWIFRYTGG